MLKQKQLTAVIGYPLGHSLSPLLHNAIYVEEGIDAEMVAIANPDIVELVKIIRQRQIELAAVTIPHKQTIVSLLDEVDEVALKIGAVNTVVNKNGKLYGYNTDIIGIERAMAGVELIGKNVLIIGAGGAARALGYFLNQADALVYWYNRTKERAIELSTELGGEVIDEVRLDNIKFEVIVNTTPVGMFPKVDGMPVPELILHKGQVVFDLIYNPLETKLLRTAREAGAKTINGLTMFVAQGLAQEEIWLGRMVENKNYEQLLTVILSKAKNPLN